MRAEPVHVKRRRKERKVHRLLPQAECHLSWEDLFHSFDVFPLQLSLMKESQYSVCIPHKTGTKRQCTATLVHFRHADACA